MYNNIKLYSNLWLYVIHSNNDELFHFLEENKVKLQNPIDIFIESIKCHHNAVAVYIRDNILTQAQLDEMSQKIVNTILETKNYYFCLISMI